MNITTMTKRADFCGASVRPRPINLLIADSRAQGQGTSVSFAALVGAGRVAVDSRFEGVVRTGLVATSKPIDVVRTSCGRPPV